jgi:ATP-dependent DNA helicase PIF1
MEDRLILRDRKEAFDREFGSMNNIDNILSIIPTILFATRNEADNLNSQKLASLKTPSHKVEALHDIRIKNPLFDTNLSMQLLNEQIPPMIELKVGCQVMLKVNLCVELGLVNGSRGVIINIVIKPNGRRNVIVDFDKVKGYQVTDAAWEIHNIYGTLRRIQIPLINAWGLTIHKSQGATLDKVAVNLGKTVFERGQSYVALSRARSLAGVYLIDYSKRSLIVSEHALEFDDSIKRK